MQARLQAESPTCKYHRITVAHKHRLWWLITREAADQQDSGAAETEADDGLHVQARGSWQG
jgi:hypothetical protein